MKKLSVVVAGTGQIRDKEIQSGTTAGDVLHQLVLQDYLVSKGPNDPFSAAAESIYTRSKTARRSSPPPKPRLASWYARKDLGTRPGTRPAPLPFAISSRGWCGGPAPLNPARQSKCSAAKFHIGRNVAGSAWEDERPCISLMSD
jgi:hypothetical protein